MGRQALGCKSLPLIHQFPTGLGLSPDDKRSRLNQDVTRRANIREITFLFINREQ